MSDYDEDEDDGPEECNTCSEPAEEGDYLCYSCRVLLPGGPARGHGQRVKIPQPPPLGRFNARRGQTARAARGGAKHSHES